MPVTHAQFQLRFSDLAGVEAACREDEEQRASRTIDWLGGRIARKAPIWVEDLDQRKKGEPMKGDTKWWEELKRCVDGDRTPARGEGWNHPVASKHLGSVIKSQVRNSLLLVVILATSTLAPNPLQAITHLHSRAIEFPPWVDANILRYTLIIHPSYHAKLSPEE